MKVTYFDQIRDAFGVYKKVYMQQQEQHQEQQQRSIATRRSCDKTIEDIDKNGRPRHWAFL